MPPTLDAVGQIASAIREGFNLLGKWMSGKERRRMQRAVEIGERMALRIKDLDIEDKPLKSLATSFFKYNN